MTGLLEEYILAHIDHEPELLREMQREAHVKLLHPTMVSGHLQGRLLKMLVQMIRPARVLEIGTYTGYSALSIAEGLEDDAALHTIEIDDEMEDMIRRYFSRSPSGKRITLHVGDAFEIIPRFGDAYFDMVFIDADKRDYWKLYETVLLKVRKGGFLLADNTLWHGKVLEETESNDWQTKGIIAFNDKLADDDRVEKVILPLRDGLTLIRKKK
ncbi:MAG: O-methyltransferase [Bacteroidales bacterium]|jgi:predicted O-methyltransferase YrrM|nr:O-methyltransferase [Bacteroidales bacterium]